MRRRSRMTPARKLACVLLAVAVVTSVVYATGAFSSTTASRSADIEVAGDGSAFLSLQPSDGPNGKYASYGTNGALQVKIGGAGLRSPATGVNPDSRTVFWNVFTITNKGSQTVSVWITGGSPSVTFMGPDGRSIEGKSNAITIHPGGRSLHVGFVIDARGVKPGTDLLKSVTIHTDPTVEGDPVPDDDGSGGNGGEDGDGDSSGGDRPVVIPPDEGEDDEDDDSDDGDENNGGGSDDGDGDDGHDSDDSDGGDDDSDDGITIEDVGTALWQILQGFLIGDWGMPGGLFGYTSPAADSIFYFFGMMLNAIASMAVTGLDIVSTIRDLGASISQGNVIGAILNALSLVPVLGAIEGASDLVKTAQKWLDAFPSQSDRVLTFLSDTILKLLPSSIGTKLLSSFTEAPVNKLSEVGIPTQDIGKYIIKDIDFNRVLDLRSKNIPASDIRYYVDRGISLKNVQRLRKLGFTPRQIKWIALSGRGVGDLGDIGAAVESFYSWCKLESSHSKHCPV